MLIKTVKIIIILIVIVLLLALIFFSLSPYLGVQITKKIMSGNVMSYPANYENYVKQVEVIQDVIYTSNYQKNTFDLYRPKTTKQNKLPTIVWVHGGGYVGGDKTDLVNFATILATYGYAVVALNYDLVPDSVYPEPLKQVGECITYLQSIKVEYQLDLENIILAGDSAGAQIVAQYALVQTNSEYATEIAIAPTLAKNSIKAMLLYCGPYDIENLVSPDQSVIANQLFSKVGWEYLQDKNWQTSNKAKEATIINHITGDFPPAYITDGNTLTFPQHGQKLVAALEEKQVKVMSRFFPNNSEKVWHEYQFMLAKPEGQLALADTIRFLEEIIKGES
jgi:Esterase/lipase